MSTNDVPGANPVNNDKLVMGCWAEHEDKSLIFVESVENGRVIYSIFNRSKTPPVEYRHALSETEFKRLFSWNPNGPSDQIKWTWHDKTPFPWDNFIDAGGQDGVRFPSAQILLTAAERVAQSLHIRGSKLQKLRAFPGQSLRRVGSMVKRLGEKLERLDGN